MLISVDGPMGSGKTSLVMLLNKFFKDSMFFCLDTINFTKGQNPLVDWASETINSGRAFFEEPTHYDENNLSIFMLLLYTARLKLIQSHPSLHENKYVFVDTFWDPLWTFEKKYINEYERWIKKIVEIPSISFFLNVGCERAFTRRMKQDRIGNPFTGEAYEKMDSKRVYFREYGKKHIPNFHVIEARQPISEVLDQIIRIIVNHEVNQ